MTFTLADINGLDAAGFIAALGAVYEDSPWVAETAFAARPFDSVAALLAALRAAVDAAGEERQVALIRAHPDLAGKAARAGALGPYSTREQAGIGLDRLSDAEFERFHRLNDAYKARFGFPFVIAVRRHTKDSILAAFETRLAHARRAEIAEALGNIHLIAEMRLGDLIA